MCNNKIINSDKPTVKLIYLYPPSMVPFISYGN